MIILGGFLVGALLGGLIAVRRKGSRLDVLQYAAGYGILFAILAVFLTILLLRMG